MKHQHYFYLADLFDFPGPDYTKKVEHLIEILSKNYPEATTELQGFLEGFQKKW